MFIIPYIVLAAVTALFLLVSYFLVFGLPGKKKKEIQEETAADLEKTMEIPLPLKEKEEAKKAAEEPVDEATQILPSLGRHGASKAQDLEEEKTKVFSRKELENTAPYEAAPAEKGPFAVEPMPDILGDKPEVNSLEEHFVRHFLNRYGAVSHTVEQDTRIVTHRLIDGLHLSEKEAVDTLTHIMVQEALQNAQRTYVMMPTPRVLEMVADAFSDVAHGKRSETKTILAYDALKAMPRMEESGFQALSLLLIFHYSRNTDNFDAAHLKRYTEKYITPFLGKLPDEYSGYQQLEYLHCISLENKEIAFGQVLHDSYPLIFAFRGSMKSELDAVYQGWPQGAVVPSLYNSYYKLAAVDETTLGTLLDDIGIEDMVTRHNIQALAESRPVAYDRKEMGYILSHISSDLSKLQNAWDTSMLRRSSLTLMGMYIAKICIRETIGEDFDLSHWM